MSTSSSGSRKTIYTILLSVCLFLGVICACLLVALVLIGRNLATQSFERWMCNQLNSTAPENSTANLDYVNDESSENDTSLNEISVKINLNTSDNKNQKYLNTPAPDWRSGWRLPRDVIPLSYDLTFHPRLKEAAFTGRTNITIRSTEPRDHFVLHGHLLNITSVEMYAADSDAKIDVINFHNDSMHQLWVVDLEDTLAPGLYYLVFEFGGTLKNRVGFYSSTYVSQNGEKRFIATSKLEPTYARQAFPCFDEPNYKAKYTVHLVKPRDDSYIALSNMNQKPGPPEILDDDNEIVHFEQSVPMSTYVTCFIVCDFNYTEHILEPKLGDNITLRVYATPAQVNKTQYALDIAVKVTDYYVNYFNIAYPLPKLDLIGIPDFVSGAMEHWGLVTFRETALLYDSEISNEANKERVATVVAHELAHMWFGNLVTLDWWNDLWLNEGFATYMQFKSIDSIISDWGMTDQFLIDQLHPVMNFDATLASHPIVQTVVTPNQITEIFDSISYNKGASVLRMLENAIGAEKFQEGITAYLNKHAYGNAVTEDLWTELQATSPNFTIKDVMDTWTVQMGYPVVHVKYDKSQGAFILTQNRFLADPDNENQGPESIYKYKWTIPITYISDNNTETSELIWFDKDEKSVLVKLEVPVGSWIKLNHGQVGYYRVNYEPEMWLSLTENYEHFSISDRANLLEDSFSIAQAGYQKYVVPLDLTKQLVSEYDYVPWAVATSKFRQLKKLLKPSLSSHQKLQKYVLKLADPICKNLTWEEEETDGHLRKLLRAEMLSFACAFDQEECKTKAQEKFSLWLKNSAEVLPVDLKPLIYRYGMEQLTETEWNEVFERYLKEIDAQEKLKLLRGLASVKNYDILRILMEKAKNESIIRSQDYFTCLQYISENEIGTPLVWDFVRDNWEYLVKRFTINDRYLGRLIPAITSSFVTETKKGEMEDFFKRYPEAGAGEISRKNALENVSNNIKWVKKYQTDVDGWLERHSNLVF